MHERSERTAEIALVAVLSGVSAAPYAAFFAGQAFVAPLVAAAAAPAAVVALAGRRRPAVVGVVLVAALPLAVAGLVRVGPGSGLTELARALAVTGRGLVGGWDAMLAAGRPADAAGDLLVTPLALTWLASTAAALLAVHRPGPGLPVVPPAVALVGALALTGDQGRYRTAVAGAFLI